MSAFPGGGVEEGAVEELAYTPVVDRRTYPAPHLEFGVLTAFKIAGIIGAPMVIVATMFGIYLNGYKAQFMLDVRGIVTEAVERHVDFERSAYAPLGEVAILKAEVERLRIKDAEIERDLVDMNRILNRLAEKNGIR